MKRFMEIKLIIIIVLLIVIAAMLAFSLGCLTAKNKKNCYSVETDGHVYIVFTYGSSISVVHDPDCPCQKNAYKTIHLTNTKP